MNYIEEIKDKINGLTYVSETDSGLVLVNFDLGRELNGANLRKGLGMSPLRPIETVTEVFDWFEAWSNRQTEDRQTILDVYTILAEMPDLKVYRIGSTNVYIFMVGTYMGFVTGARCESVET